MFWSLSCARERSQLSKPAPIRPYSLHYDLLSSIRTQQSTNVSMRQPKVLLATSADSSDTTNSSKKRATLPSDMILSNESANAVLLPVPQRWSLKQESNEPIPVDPGTLFTYCGFKVISGGVMGSVVGMYIYIYILSLSIYLYLSLSVSLCVYVCMYVNTQY